GLRRNSSPTIVKGFETNQGSRRLLVSEDRAASCCHKSVFRSGVSGAEKMAPLSDVSIVELKTCPRCEESLPLSEFGICRARKDGLNLYCKRCIRQKIALSRAALREYKKARVKHGGTTASQKGAVSLDGKTAFSSKRIARMLRKLSPADRVREAIRCGAE